MKQKKENHMAYELDDLSVGDTALALVDHMTWIMDEIERIDGVGCGPYYAPCRMVKFKSYGLPVMDHLVYKHLDSREAKLTDAGGVDFINYKTMKRK